MTFSWAIWLSLQENSQPVIFTPVSVKGWTVVDRIWGRPIWQVMYCPALVPLVCTCLYAVPRTSVGVVSVDPRAYLIQNPIESATAFAASPDVNSMVRSPATSNRDCTVREPRLNACPDFSPWPSSQFGLNVNDSERSSYEWLTTVALSP